MCLIANSAFLLHNVTHRKVSHYVPLDGLASVPPRKLRRLRAKHVCRNVALLQPSI